MCLINADVLSSHSISAIWRWYCVKTAATPVHRVISLSLS